MSKVGNLRAMFEQRGESSPPDRGRSPGIPPGLPLTQPTGSESPRPLSKVRTSFIAVEKDGRIGLQRDRSDDSSVSRRKLSGELAGETPPALQEKTNVFGSTMEKVVSNSSASSGTAPTSFSTGRTNLANEPIPESPRTDAAPPSAVQKKANTQAGAPGSNPDKHTDIEDPKAKMLPGGPTDKIAVKNGALYEAGGFGEELNGADAGKLKTKTAGASGASKTATKAHKAAPISVGQKTTTKATKSPKTPTSPSVSQQKLTAKTPERKAVEPAKTAAPKTTSITGASSKAATPAPSSAKKPPPITVSPSSTGFVKPKPKSPTKPVKLPPGLMTHTAASGSKVNGPRQSMNPPRQSLSRQSGIYASSQHIGRSPSRASVTSTTTAKGLKRQSSTINRPRPSLGLPPKQPAKDHPPTKRETAVDEGFLARMMRPTQASSSKTHEKVAVSPPRKPAAAPAKRPAAVKHTVPRTAVKKENEVKKVVPKAAPVAKSHPAPPKKEEKEEKPDTEKSAAKEVAPVVEQVATAEEAITVAKEAEGTVPLPVEEVEPAASESIPAVAQVDGPAPEVVKEEAVAEPVEKVEAETEVAEPAAVPRASEAEPEAFNEPEVEEAAAPLLNGDHDKKDETPAADPAPVPEAEHVVEPPAAEEVTDEKAEEEKPEDSAAKVADELEVAAKDAPAESQDVLAGEATEETSEEPGDKAATPTKAEDEVPTD
ncbi:hypothetical protein NKR23_g2773 [Pleurostoma richardsiae]|uniref:Uncharacterized protein n=1 Tax=Pleurostoma richardsiae TaxID=41990 RepID=A0AA38RLD1_9PEZI|nr:hypothetical protein NKR23_g2773 [Pleurostoma richardsiae]